MQLEGAPTMVKQQQREREKESKREKRKGNNNRGRRQKTKEGFVRDSKRGMTREKQQGWMDGWRERSCYDRRGGEHTRPMAKRREGKLQSVSNTGWWWW